MTLALMRARYPAGRRAVPRSLRLSRLLMPAWGAGVFEDTYLMRWLGRQAVVTLREHIDVSNAAEIREELWDSPDEVLPVRGLELRRRLRVCAVGRARRFAGRASAGEASG